MPEKQFKPMTYNDHQFLMNEVLLAADVILEMVPAEDVFSGMTCSEAEAFACIFAAAQRQDVYDFIIDQHKVHDEPEELEFHEAMKDGAALHVPGDAHTAEYEKDVRGCSCGMADYGAPGHDHDPKED